MLVKDEGKAERKTVAWRQKFMELAGLTVGPEAMNMEPDAVIERARDQGENIQGLLGEVENRLSAIRGQIMKLPV